MYDAVPNLPYQPVSALSNSDSIIVVIKMPTDLKILLEALDILP